MSSRNISQWISTDTDNFHSLAVSIKFEGLAQPVNRLRPSSAGCCSIVNNEYEREGTTSYGTCFRLNSSSFLCSCQPWKSGERRKWIYQKTRKERNRRWEKLKMASNDVSIKAYRDMALMVSYCFHFIWICQHLDRQQSERNILLRLRENTKWLSRCETLHDVLLAAQD